jgi:hypothetical protein
MNAFESMRLRLESNLCTNPTCSHKTSSKLQLAGLSDNNVNDRSTSKKTLLSELSSTHGSNAASTEQISEPVVWPLVVTSDRTRVETTIDYGLIRDFEDASGIRTRDFGWTYKSRGLAARNGCEVVIDVLCRETEDSSNYPTDPMSMFDDMFDMNKPIRRGTVLLFDCPLFGREDFTAVYFPLRIVQKSSPREGSRAAPDLLHCIAVTDTEYDASLSAGFTRVLVRLGLSKHWYPCPPHIDRDRKSCITLEEVHSSIPGRGSPVNVKGLAAYRQQSQVVLEVPAYARLNFQEEVLAANMPRIPSFWIFSDIHETCDSAYVWRADGVAPDILCARVGVPKRIAAGFLMFCPGQRRNSVRLFGDGFLGMAQSLAM